MYKKIVSVLFCCWFLSANAESLTIQDLANKLDILEKKIERLEKQLSSAKNNEDWKDPILWLQIKKDMTTSEIAKLMGSPAKIEEAIFVTWYYHRTSKLHSFIWFDEGKVLGWKAPAK
ncbi:MAG: hypothetical protein HQL46_04365 [Gammaproteobacteria bacterium]|nr:hypothetical protein [Gammaproteobacteria bacterium]